MSQDYEHLNGQLNDYYSFVFSILHFLQKYLVRFQNSLLRESTVLRQLQAKSEKLHSKTNLNNGFQQHVQHAFRALNQIFDDEYHQLEQRAKLVRLIGLASNTLRKQIQSSDVQRAKRQLQKQTWRLRRFSRNRNRRTVYSLKYNQSFTAWKDQLDTIASQTATLLWKLCSYSPYKCDYHQLSTPPPIDEPIQAIHIEIGSGDRASGKDPLDRCKEQGMSNSNNALENVSHSTSLDQSLIDKNLSLADSTDDERWMALIQRNPIHWQDLSTSEEDDDLIIEHQKTSVYRRIKSLHLSDLSYTTDYYSQNDSH